MELKRNFRDDGSEDWGGPPKRRLAFPEAVRNVIKGVSLNDIMTKIEPLFRRVVREEIECFVHTLHQSRSAHNRIEPLENRGLELRFESKIPSTIFTGSRIEAEDSTAVKVVLIDARTSSIVASGPMSCVKIEVVALNSDFASDDQQNWTEQSFADSILRQREGKRPLITGELNVTLKNGVGYISEVSFTDNSSWTRSRKFKLGARVVQRISSDVRIREAASEAFVVKDHRGELYKKHHPPHLHDEVWRLERIAKDGPSHKRLAAYGIMTLMDFLRLYFTDSSMLRRVIGGGISNKVWNAIIEHAKECVLNDDKLYVYYRDQAGIFFNLVYNAVGVTFDGHNYLSLDSLSSPQKLFVEDLKRRAYKNVHNIVPFDQASVSDFARPLESLQAETFSVTNTNVQHLDFPIIQQESLVGFNDTEASTSYAGGLEAAGAKMEHDFDSIPTSMYSPMMRNCSFRMVDFTSGTNGLWCPNGEVGSGEVQTTTTWSPAVPWGSELGGFDFMSCLPNMRRRKSKAGWCKIRAAIKWKISARKRRMGRFVWNY